MSIVGIAPIQYKDEAGIKLPPKEAVTKEAVRYVADLGDFIEARDKIQLASIGARSGGLRVGPSENEGAPTMWRTDYLIRRGAFTPLEPTVVVAHSDEKNRDHKSIGQRQALPGDDMTLLGDDSFRELGVVEITALRGALWADNQAIELNRHFFPQFDAWLAGAIEFPKYLRIYEELIRNAPIITDAHVTTKDELLESVRQFRAYATAQIGRNRARIEATRAIDMAGFTIGWSERTKLFAEQLEITLEKESDIKPTQTATVTDSPEMVDLKKREFAIRERELEIKEREMGMGKEEPPVSEPDTASESVLSEDRICGQPSANGVCNRKLKGDETECWQHVLTTE